MRVHVKGLVQQINVDSQDAAGAIRHSESARSKSSDNGIGRERVPRRHRIAEWTRAKEILQQIQAMTADSVSEEEGEEGEQSVNKVS